MHRCAIVTDILKEKLKEKLNDEIQRKTVYTITFPNDSQHKNHSVGNPLLNSVPRKQVEN